MSVHKQSIGEFKDMFPDMRPGRHMGPTPGPNQPQTNQPQTIQPQLSRSFSAPNRTPGRRKRQARFEELFGKSIYFVVKKSKHLFSVKTTFQCRY